MTATDIVADYKEGGNFVATLKDANGNAVNGAMITLKLGSITRVLYTDSNGQVSFNTDDLFPDTYPTTAVYSGDNTYEGSSAEAQVVINKLDTVLTAKYDYNSNNVVATVKDAKGRPVSWVIVGFERAGSRMLLATDQNGEARYHTGGLPKGYYSVDIKADANNIYKESNMITFNFTVGIQQKTKIFLRNALFFVTETKMVRVTLWDGNNNHIAGKLFMSKHITPHGVVKPMKTVLHTSELVSDSVYTMLLSALTVMTSMLHPTDQVTSG